MLAASAANSPVVLALHGSASTGRQWRSLSEATAGTAKVVAPDLPGYGRSAALTSDRLTWLCARVSALRRPVHVVGHSFGGAVAVRLAQVMPRAVKSLTLYDPLIAELGALPRALEAVWREHGTGAPSALARAFLEYWGGVGQWARLTAAQRQRLVLQIPALKRDFREVTAGAWAPHGAPYGGPVVALWGKDSPSATADMAVQLSRACTHVQHIWLAGHGHFSPLSSPTPIAAALLAQLAEGTEPPHGTTTMEGRQRRAGCARRNTCDGARRSVGQGRDPCAARRSGAGCPTLGAGPACAYADKNCRSAASAPLAQIRSSQWQKGSRNRASPASGP